MAARRPKTGPSTRSVHAGEEGPSPFGAVTLPVYQTSTFVFPSVGDLRAHAEGRSERYLYTRHGNPTLQAAEDKLADLEQGDDALVFSSGMAAISTTVTALAAAGDEVLAHRDLYGGTLHLFRDLLPRTGITVRTFSDVREIPRLVTPRTRILYFESPTNPLLQVVDIRAAVSAVRGKRSAKGKGKVPGILTVIDNTFATPINQRPLELGVDVVVHSATKYLAGHSDLIAGAAAGSTAIIRRIREQRKYLGGVLDPLGGFLLLRGLKTLALRVEAQNRSALSIARFLAGRKDVRRVCYPFLPRHPGYRIARRQMTGGTGMLSLDLGSARRAERFVDSLDLFANAPSLGGPESLATIPVLTSHLGLPAKELAATGVTPGLVRLSIGLEDPADLTEDLEWALRGASR